MRRPRLCVYWSLARQSGHVHLGEVPRLEHHGGDPVGGGLVAQRDEDLPAALALKLRIKGKHEASTHTNICCAILRRRFEVLLRRRIVRHAP